MKDQSELGEKRCSKSQAREKGETGAMHGKTMQLVLNVAKCAYAKSRSVLVSLLDLNDHRTLQKLCN